MRSRQNRAEAAHARAALEALEVLHGLLELLQEWMVGEQAQAYPFRDDLLARLRQSRLRRREQRGPFGIAAQSGLPVVITIAHGNRRGR